MLEYKNIGDTKPVQTIPLISVMLRNVKNPKIKDVKHVFKLEIPETNGMYLKAESEEEMKEWMTTILIQTLGNEHWNFLHKFQNF